MIAPDSALRQRYHIFDLSALMLSLSRVQWHLLEINTSWHSQHQAVLTHTSQDVTLCTRLCLDDSTLAPSITLGRLCSARVCGVPPGMRELSGGKGCSCGHGRREDGPASLPPCREEGFGVLPGLFLIHLRAEGGGIVRGARSATPYRE